MNIFHFKLGHFYQIGQVDVNIIVGKEIGPSQEPRLENIFMIYE